jgi:hypothetical protein
LRGEVEGELAAGLLARGQGGDAAALVALDGAGDVGGVNEGEPGDGDALEAVEVGRRDEVVAGQQVVARPSAEDEAAHRDHHPAVDLLGDELRSESLARQLVLHDSHRSFNAPRSREIPAEVIGCEPRR